MTWVAVGTAAAIGAGVGAGSQIIQGKSGDDILKGALIGGTTGALTGGAGAAFGGSAGGAGGSLTTEAAAQLAPELTQAAATNIAPEIVGQTATNVLPQAAGQGITQIPQGFTAAEINAINMGNADALASSSSPFAPLASGPVTSDVAATPLVQTPTPFQSMTRPEMAQMTFAETGQYPVQPPLTTPPGAAPEAPITSSGLVSEPPTNPFVQGFNDVTNYIEKNPFKSAAMGYLGLNAIGAFRNAQQPMTFGGPSYSQTYSLSPNFQGGPYTRPNVYQERRYNYASGGIAQLQAGGPVERMSQMNTAMNPQGGLYPQGMIDKTQYATPTQRPASMEIVETEPAYQRSNPLISAAGMAEGGITALRRGGTPNASESLDRYLSMMEGKKSASVARPDVGIFEDKDPDTMYQDALTAALIRQGKINKRASMGAPTIGRPTPMGTINLAPPGTQMAAAGGIMGYSLGGYADGGNPRLLKGPGDGMSDNIPATIADRQPARLADGEFVVPADVVSGLGNGSTNAGAKKLHKMMDKVRVARTGKKKQAPAIKGEKYLA
jgi:hypothetical protein